MAFSDLTRASVPANEENSLFKLPATRISWTWWTAWIALFAALSMIVPRDASYDVVHYHLHNGWATLNGRDGFDLAPAEMHTYLNPVWQIFVWLLVDNLPGRVVAFILGAIHALSLPAVYAFTRRVLVRAGAQPSLIAVIAIAVAGFMSQSQLGMLGSVRNDAVFAGMCVAALALILPTDRTVAKTSSFALASFLIGSLMGIKLTSAIYMFMFAIPALILMPNWKARLHLGGVCAVAGLAGLTVFGGPWALYLWDAYGNPIFPQLNAYFDAPLGPDIAFRDTRMLPDTFLGALLKPLVMLYDATYTTGAYEHYFDPRLQMTYVCGLILIGLPFLKRADATGPGDRMGVALGVGGFVAILIWVLMFSFSRYVAAAWLIGPSMLALTVALYRPKVFELKYASLVTLSLATILVLVSTSLPLRRVAWTSWGERYITAEVPTSIDYSNAIVAFTGGYPSAFLAPYFPEETLMTHLVPQDWSAPALANYRHKIRAEMTSGNRKPYAVIVDVEGHFAETEAKLLETENITVEKTLCVPIKTNLETPEAIWVICPLIQN